MSIFKRNIENFLGNDNSFFKMHILAFFIVIHFYFEDASSIFSMILDCDMGRNFIDI